MSGAILHLSSRYQILYLLLATSLKQIRELEFLDKGIQKACFDNHQELPFLDNQRNLFFF